MTQMQTSDIQNNFLAMNLTLEEVNELVYSTEVIPGSQIISYQEIIGHKIYKPDLILIFSLKNGS